MRKIYKLLLALVLALSIMPAFANTVNADTVLPSGAVWLNDSGEDHVWYKYTDENNDGTKETLVIGGTGAMKDFTTLLYAQDVQPWINSVTSLTILEGVTKIGKYAFCNTDITTVSIPSTVVDIRAFAFEQCKLTEVKFANNSQLERIGESVFSNNKLTSITFPASLKSLYGKNVLYNNPELSRVTFLGSPDQIDTNAFNGIGIISASIIDADAYNLLLEDAKKEYFPIDNGGSITYGKKTEKNVELMLPKDWSYIKKNKQGRLCNGYFIDHTHSLKVVAGKYATRFEDGYHLCFVCTSCGKHFEDREATSEIKDLTSWRKKGGRGFLPCTDPNHKHVGEYRFGIEATINYDGYKPYYECECGACFEDKDCTIAIENIDAWLKEGGNGYLPQLGHTHQPITHYSKNPTIYYDGYATFYLCSCGKYFEDVECTIEITDLSSWTSEGGRGFIPRIVEKEDYTQLVIAIIACVIVAGLIVTYIIINKKEKQEEVKEVEKATKTTKKTTKKTKKTE